MLDPEIEAKADDIRKGLCSAPQTEQGWQKVWAWCVWTETGFKLFAKVERRKIVLGPIGGMETGPQVHWNYRDVPSYDE
jgi:hypothetical protein